MIRAATLGIMFIGVTGQLVHAQWSLNGAKTYYTAGNVGIGTINPAYTLDVRSAGARAISGLSTPVSGTHYGIYAQSNSTTGRALYALANANSGINFAVVGKTNSPIGFASWFVGGKNYFEGKVGIGGSNPSQQLQVVGNVKATGWFGTDVDAPVELRSKNTRVFTARWVSDVGIESVNVIGGYEGNGSANTSGVGTTIAGGGALIGGVAHSNQATNNYASVGGGIDNEANGFGSTIAGGVANSANSSYSFIGGGLGNYTNGFDTVVAGGESNSATFDRATVGGGQSNTASADSATVPGGHSNTAAGAYSFAAGRRAKANHTGSFVWGDSTNADISSFASNSFVVRAVNGFVFYTNSGLTSGAAMGAGSGSWTSLSDRNHKCDIKPVDPKEILNKVAAMPVSTWRYDSQDKSVRHIGPMAQDFHAAFQVGDFENGITVVDADGVALAAIQGLHQSMQEKDREIQDLKRRLAQLEALVRQSHPSGQAD